MKGIGCRKFNRLLNEIADRETTPREQAFLESHRETCPVCFEEERAANTSLHLLRDCAFQYGVEDAFDRRVLRRAKLQSVHDGFRYWSPAFTGGLVAATLLLAAVQALTRPITTGTPQNVEASRGVQGSLAMKTIPTLKR